jgi:hypothetical protein
MYRHQEVSNVVHQYVQKRIPDIAISVTPSLNSTLPGVRNIIPDLYISPTGRSGKYIDFTISNPAAPSNCGPSAPIQAALVPNITNITREREKNDKYAHTVNNIVSRNMFVPFAVEATGRLGPRALSYLFELFPKDTMGFSKAVPLIKQIGTIVCRHNTRAALYLSKGLRQRSEGVVNVVW